jgi:hypothetical protein
VDLDRLRRAAVHHHAGTLTMRAQAQELLRRTAAWLVGERQQQRWHVHVARQLGALARVAGLADVEAVARDLRMLSEPHIQLVLEGRWVEAAEHVVNDSSAEEYASTCAVVGQIDAALAFIERETFPPAVASDR